jgi:hypothetical protein
LLRIEYEENNSEKISEHENIKKPKKEVKKIQADVEGGRFAGDCERFDRAEQRFG